MEWKTMEMVRKENEIKFKNLKSKVASAWQRQWCRKWWIKLVSKDRRVKICIPGQWMQSNWSEQPIIKLERKEKMTARKGATSKIDGNAGRYSVQRCLLLPRSQLEFSWRHEKRVQSNHWRRDYLSCIKETGDIVLTEGFHFCRMVREEQQYAGHGMNDVSQRSRLREEASKGYFRKRWILKRRKNDVSCNIYNKSKLTRKCLKTTDQLECCSSTW